MAITGCADHPTRPAAPSTRGRRAGRRTGRLAWVLQILSAAVLLAAAVPKLMGTEVAVEAFDDIGGGQWLRSAIGVTEVAGAIGLLLRWAAGLAATCLAALMVGATATNLAVLDDPGAGATTAVLLAILAFIAWRRLPELDLRRPADRLGAHR